MYRNLMLMSTASRWLASHEREPPVPPGEPTILNQERMGQRIESFRRQA